MECSLITSQFIVFNYHVDLCYQNYKQIAYCIQQRKVLNQVDKFISCFFILENIMEYDNEVFFMNSFCYVK